MKPAMIESIGLGFYSLVISLFLGTPTFLQRPVPATLKRPGPRRPRAPHWQAAHPAGDAGVTRAGDARTGANRRLWRRRRRGGRGGG